MGSLAGLLKARGIHVSGTDAGLYPPMSTALERWEIPVNEGFSAANVAEIDAMYEAGRQLIDPTGFPGPGPEQCGASCNWAQNYSTDAYVHGLRHPARLLGDVVGFLDRG